MQRKLLDFPLGFFSSRPTAFSSPAIVVVYSIDHFLNMTQKSTFFPQMKWNGIASSTTPWFETPSFDCREFQSLKIANMKENL